MGKWNKVLRWLVGPGYDEYFEEEEYDEEEEEWPQELTVSPKDVLDARIIDMYCVLKALASKYAMQGKGRETEIVIQSIKTIEETFEIGRGEVPDPKSLSFWQLFEAFFEAAKFVLDRIDDREKWKKMRNDVVWRIHMLFGEYLLNRELK